MTQSPEQTMYHFHVRISTKQAAKELQMDVLTLQVLVQKDRLPIGYALKKRERADTVTTYTEGCSMRKKSALALFK